MRLLACAALLPDDRTSTHLPTLKQVDILLRVNEEWDWIVKEHGVEPGHIGHAFMDQVSIWVAGK